MKPMFSPSLMCMDFLDIKNQAEILNRRCDFYHIDIMDGHFVPNITLSPSFVEAFKKVADKPLECVVRGLGIMMESEGELGRILRNRY